MIDDNGSNGTVMNGINQQSPLGVKLRRKHDGKIRPAFSSITDINFGKTAFAPLMAALPPASDANLTAVFLPRLANRRNYIS